MSDGLEHRRQEPLYELFRRLDEFLHLAASIPSLKREADILHGEVHEASYAHVHSEPYLGEGLGAKAA